MRIDRISWPTYRDLVASRVLVLPIGAVDAHGPHLPLSTDTVVSSYLANRLEDLLDLLVLPPVPYGLRTAPASGGGEFPGVTNLRGATLTNVVLDILRSSYRHGARRFLILDSHKANAGAVSEAVDCFIESSPNARVMAVAWWDVVSESTRNEIANETGVRREDDHHAAMVETSLMMFIAPQTVDYDSLHDDDSPRRARYFVAPVPDALKTQHGVVYRAGRATRAIGERLMDEIITNLVAAVRLELA